MKNTKISSFNFDRTVGSLFDRSIVTELNEGLITTYDISKCRNHLMTTFPFIKHVTGFVPNRYGNNSARVHGKLSDTRLNDMFFISISSEQYDDIDDIITICDRLYGWFISRISVRYINRYKNLDEEIFWYNSNNFVSDDDVHLSNFVIMNDIKEFYLYFEAKYSIEVPYMDDVTLYHATNCKNLKRIIKYGLIPKNNDDHPERIYFSTNMRHIKRMLFDRIDFPELTYLRIIPSKNSLYKFYNDGRTIESVFTLDCINPKYLEIMINGNWKKLTQITVDEIEKIQNN